jgi:hypothetical protein
MKRLLGCLVALALAALVTAPLAGATQFTLTDLNSVFAIESSSGANFWSVEGTNQLYFQGFWFRLGDQTGETSLGNYFSSGWVSEDQRIASLTYVHPDFTASVVYTLTGGTAGSNTSDVAESIRLINTTTRELPVRFFQYCDFDLGGTIGDDILRFPNANAVQQQDGSGGGMLSETVITPVANHHEGDLFANTLNRLNDELPTTLNDLPAYGGGSIQGDATWAFEWDRTLAAGGAFVISKDKHLAVVPEPTTLLLLGVGLVGAEIARRRRNKA